jgi:hypothetical protein
VQCFDCSGRRALDRRPLMWSHGVPVTLTVNVVCADTGNVEIGTLSCQLGALLNCQGSIRVDGVDGNAVMRSHGAPVSLTVNDGASLVSVSR